MKKRNLFKSIAAFAIIVFCTENVTAQLVSSDQWAATDALGRKVSDYNDAGEKREDKVIAMFYWTWHQGDDDTTYGVKTVSYTHLTLPTKRIV